MAKKGEIKIDTTRNLCDSCKHNYPDCDGDPEFGNNVGQDNVIKCNTYRKKPKTLLPRVANGESYWVFIRKDDNNPNELIPHKRVESKDNRLGAIYHEEGNYFHKEEECIQHINKLKEKRNGKR